MATNSWSETTPADTDLASTLGSKQRQIRLDIRERMEEDHDWAVGSTNNAKHKKVTLLEQASDPAASANEGYLYTKDDGGDTELFYRDDSGNIIQLTKDGKLNNTALLLLNNVALQGNDSGATARDLLLIDGADDIRIGPSSGIGNIVLSADINNGLKARVSGSEYTIWHENNDGAGTGLNADLLDGQEGASYLGFAASQHHREVFTIPASGGISTQPHGLSAVPRDHSSRLRCVTAELGYSIGDVVPFDTAASSSPSNVQCTYDDTNVSLMRRGSGNIEILRKDTRAGAGITDANWEVDIRLYK